MQPPCTGIRRAHGAWAAGHQQQAGQTVPGAERHGSRSFILMPCSCRIMHEVQMPAASVHGGGCGAMASTFMSA